MKKRLVAIVLALAAALCLCCGLSACSKVVYKLNFVVDDEVYATINTSGEEKIVMPKDPTKEEYLFDGWYWDKDVWQRPFTADSLLHEKLTSDMSVYAKWLEEDITKRNYTITFNSMGGSTVEEATVLYGHLLTEPAKPTRTGYIFVGWYKEADCSTKWDFAADTITKDLTLYAKWVDESDATGSDILAAEGFNVSGNTLSVKVPHAQEYFVLSSAITVSPYATWTVSSDISGNNLIPSATVSLNVGDNTYYINVTSGNGSNKKQYTVNIRRREIYNVTYQPNNGDADIVEQVEEDQKLENKVVEKTGYSFTAWQYQGVAWDFGQGIGESMTLTATWQANSYTVTFDSADGSTVEEATATYDEEFEFEVPTRKGYTFNGWKTADGTLFTDGDGKGEDVWKIADDTELTADWTVNEYTITYHGAEGATNTNETAYTVEDEKITLSDASKTGFTFLGWFDAQDNGTKVTEIDTSKAVNVELWAKWAPIQYKATFKTEESEQQVAFTIEDDAINEPVIPEKYGYTGVWEDYEIEAHDLTINAIYTPIEYPIYYLDTKDAKNPNPETYNIEQEFELQPLEKDGYIFKGWFVGDDEVNKIGRGSTEEKSFTAKWTAIEYSITYENTKEAVNSNPATYNIEQEIELQPLQKEGYTFNGWFVGKDEVKKIEVGSTGEKILTAKWTPIDYDIQYTNTKGANNPNPDSYNIETNTFTLQPLEKNGYEFIGWFVGDDQIEEITVGSTGEKTLEARWTAVTYHIKYENTKDAENSNQTSYNIETPTFQLNPLEKAGYKFDGWFEGKVQVIEVKVGSTGEKTLEAHWTPIDYTIHYTNTKEAQNPNQTSYNIETATFTLQPLKKDGYTFAGWFEGGQKVEKIQQGSYGEKTLEAHWTATQYELHLEYEEEIGGYAEGESNPDHFTVESDFALKPLVIKTVGYTFLGWFTEKNDGEGKKVDAIRPGRTESLTLYAHWGLEVYTITYHNVDGVENTNAKNYTVKSDPIEIKTLSKLGYTFEGWFSDKGLQQQADTTIETGSYGNLDFYAKWSLVNYHITYTLYDGHYENGESNPDTYTIETDLQLKNPVKDGYVFDGWYDQTEGGNKITEIKQGMTGQLTLYARWIYISTITFDTKDGSPIEPIRQAAGSDVSAPTENPTKDYYTFAGWYEDEDCQTEYHFSKMPDKDITVYAKWTPIEYQIFYHLDDGQNAKENPATYNYESAFELKDPSKIGHTFLGWFTSDGYTERVERVEAGTHDELHLYARFQINDYTITFQTNGGTSVEKITQNYGTKVDEPANPSKDGYKFAGWYTEQALRNKYTFSTMPADNITLWAKWDCIEYDIHYNLEGGVNAPENPSTYNIESKTITLQEPTRRGYKFVGWYLDASYETEIKTIDHGSYGEKEIYAKWDIITYEIKYILPDGATHNNPKDYTVETALTALEAATLKGHRFDGWFTEAEYTNEAKQFGNGEIGEKTFYAKFTPNTYTVWLDGTEEATATVTFNANGAPMSAPSPQAVTETQSLTYPTMTWDGHLFAGWYTTSQCDGEPFDFTAIISHDVTLYAKWIDLAGANLITINKSVSVTLQGKTELIYRFVPLVSGNVTITTTGTIDTLGSLYRGDMLLKMDDDSGSSTGTGNNFLIVYNVTAGEVYEIRVRGYSTSAIGTTTLSLTGSELPTAGGHTQTGNRTEITYGDDNFTLTVPTRGELEKFLGWMDINGILYTDETGHAIKAWDKDETTVLFSKWERMEYTVTFVTNGGSDVAGTVGNKVTLEYGARLDINFYTTTWAGHTFLGWFESLSADNPYNASTMPDHNITLQAKWTNYGLGEIKYDEDKKAISVHDDLNAELFGAICLDTDGKPATITVMISGEQTAGQTVNIVLVAQVDGVIPKRQTIAGVKVYGDPTISVSDESRGYVNLSEKIGEWNGEVELNSTLFGGSGADTFGAATTIRVTVEGEFEAGQTVTIVIHSIDPAGNDTTKEIQNVKVYGEPVITYNEEKLEVRQSDKLTAELFSATAKDSFNEDVTVKVTRWSGTQSAGRTITVRLTATDEKGNTKTIDIQVKVYGTPTMSAPTTTDFKVEDDITVEDLGLTAQDTYGELLEITLTHTGDQKAGKTMIFTAKVTDIAGNTKTIDIQVKIYGTPTITVGRTAVKVEEEVTVESFRVTAKDSFGNLLQAEIEKISGVQEKASTMYYKITAVDHVGNKKTLENFAIKVYAQEDIKLTYQGGAAQNIKLTSCGEEFFASATDSFGEACAITLEAASGFTLKGGNTVSLYIVATDAAGNIAKSDLISNIKVYGMPTIRPADESKGYTMTEGDNLQFLFIVEDSFGVELYYTAETSDEIIAGEIITVLIQATDPVGNKFSEKIQVNVIKEGTAYVELYEDDELYQQLIVEDCGSYTLSFPDGYSDLLPYWADGDGIRYTDDLGNGVKNLPQYIRLYLQTEFQLIRSVQEFKQMELTGMYMLMQDLNFSGKEWTPIGTENAPFAGVFNGNGHVIKNFKITKSTEYAGLFGRSIGVIRDLGVENFTINVEWWASASPYSYAGGLVGYNGGTIMNCYATGDVTATPPTGTASSGPYAGGLVGDNGGGMITNCYATGNVTATATSSSSLSYAGGLVGSDSGTITNCYATGNVTATSSYSYAGGLVGYKDSGGTITNCYATGNVTATSSSSYSHAGGLVGYNYYCTITNCYATGNVEATASREAHAGGLVGYNGGDTIMYCYATGNVTATTPTDTTSSYACAGGLVGYNGGTIMNCYATGDVTATSSKAFDYENAYAGGLVGRNGRTITDCYRYSKQTVTAKKGSSNGTMATDGSTTSLSNLQSSSFLTDTLGWDSSVWEFRTNDYPALYKEKSSKTSIVYIQGKEDFVSLAGNDLYADYILTTDIDLGNMEWTPINLYGVFLGNSHTVKNFKITASTQYVGFLGRSNGVIRNLGVESFTINISQSSGVVAGGLVGENYGVIINCYAMGNVTATATSTSSSSRITASVYAGGLVGDNFGGTLTNCYAIGDVTATAASRYSESASYAGGLMGKNDNGTLTNCYATGDVAATATVTSSSYRSAAYAGGLVGDNFGGTIMNCYATGDVTETSSSSYAYSYTGGLVGKNRGTITNCYATGNVTATATSTSSSSRITASVYAGGLVGDNYCTITNCYATGNVTATSSYASAGGLVGDNGALSSSVGTIVGTITNCYATGNVTATSSKASVGGLVGLMDKGTITNSYRYSEQTVMATEGSSGGMVSTYGTATALENLQSESFLMDTLGWDPSVWEFHVSAFPTLK